jgi:aspartate/glutamate racemase
VDPAALAPAVHALVEKYGADGIVVGCSEVHILANHLASAASPLHCIDPFLAIAAQLGAPRRTPEPAAPS